MAASVNPIDVARMKGYGSMLIQILRERAKGRYLASILFNRGEMFPITLGRGYAWVDVGQEVKAFQKGQRVYGTLEMTSISSSHGQYIVVPEDAIQLKPVFLSFAEATSIPHVAMTTWSALKCAGKFTKFENKNFLLVGGSGGVGTFAIQYLKSQGARITTTCSANAISLLLELGADYCVDYRSSDLEKIVESHGPYDCIFDMGGLESGGTKFIPFAQGGQYITITGPAILNINKWGILFGTLKTAFDFIWSNVSSRYYNGVSYKWGFVSSDKEGWEEIASLVNQKKIKPIVQEVFNFEELPLAYKKVLNGHMRGKIVVQIGQEEAIESK